MDIRGLNTETNGGVGYGCLSEEEMEDRMKFIAWEIEMDKNKETTKADAAGIPIPNNNKKEPTPEHLLLREYADTARNWEKAMRAKYTEGQAAEIMGRIFENLRKHEFPDKLYHNWTDDLMYDTKIGWQKFRAFQELVKKYPQQNMEQMYQNDTNEWIMLDR